MAADASAYAALGLAPGADAAAIDRAYKTLIKQFHPDRAGGDATRAAEITRAYRELRSTAREALVFEDYESLGGGETRWIRIALALAAAGVVALLLGRPFVSAVEPSAALEQPRPPRAAAGNAMDEPIDFAAVDGAIGDAVRMARAGDELALAQASRTCQHEMQQRPTFVLLDRCAAFDDAVAQLQDRDPLRDRGPFSELAVTGRKMSAATMLSNDYLAIDSRLDRIRLHVELALVPRQPERDVSASRAGSD